MYVANPIVREIKDNIQALQCFEDELNQDINDKSYNILRNYPTVYIHNSKQKNGYEVYVGESNDVFKRTRQHYEAAKNKDTWQNGFFNKDSILYIIGHEHFNKSLTLDVENKLILYLMSTSNINHVRLTNSRGNPQNSYYPVEELDDIFSKIWKSLRKKNSTLFPSENEVKDSAIYKASPLHKLTPEQLNAKELILHKVKMALEKNERGQLIFVDGEAGTGKTVLNSSTFYELFCGEIKNDDDFSAYLLVNHDEQISVYTEIAKKLDIHSKNDKDPLVDKPTKFINRHKNDEEPVSVCFVDEAHLLLTQGKQAYQGKNQLEDIIKLSRVTVVMFDENQILTTEQYWESKIIEHYRQYASKDNNHILLQKQLRMLADKDILNWIDMFTKQNKLLTIPKSNKYDIEIFDSPFDLETAIKEKAQNKCFSLSRMIATYDWEYSSNRVPSDASEKYWEVKIGNWHKPWNRELRRHETSRKLRKEMDKKVWAEQSQTIDEVGSTFTIQGFDLNYAGVILGPSVKYQNGKIIFDPNACWNSKVTQNRTLSDGSKQKFSEELIKHSVRVLMTRGVNGLYIYACDAQLRQALLKAKEGIL